MLEKGLEVRGIVVAAHALGDGRLLGLIKARPGGIAGALGQCFEVTRTPSFASEANGVATLLQEVGIRLEDFREETPVRHGLLELPGVSARQNARTAGAAFRIGSERALEEHALLCHAVEVRRLDPVATISPSVRAAVPVIEDDEEDVRLLRFRVSDEAGQGESESEQVLDHGGRERGALRFLS